MRTQEEIIKRIKEIKDSDVIGFETADLMCALTFENVQLFFKKDHDVTEDEWNPLTTDEDILEGMIKYLEFAHEKASSHRGISASRSISHFKSWLWLIGNDELYEFADDWNNYAQYGAPIIKKLADHFGVELPDDADFNAMAEGRPCHSCGRGDMHGCDK